MKMRKISLTALLLSFSLVVSIVEGMIPVSAFVHIPGVKLGFANIATMAALIYLGKSAALFIAVARPLIMLILFGNPTGFIFSLCGGMLALLCAILFIGMYDRACTYIGISILCALSHSAGQMLAASVTLSFSALYYLPPLIIGSAITGAVTGILMNIIFSRVKL